VVKQVVKKEVKTVTARPVVRPEPILSLPLPSNSSFFSYFSSSLSPHYAPRHLHHRCAHTHTHSHTHTHT
jgi:hypothetical protein